MSVRRLCQQDFCFLLWFSRFRWLTRLQMPATELNQYSKLG